jgi:hypothetical protein
MKKPAGFPGQAPPEQPVARIIAVADALDAMTSRRPCRLPCPLDEAVEEIRLCAGTQFDPALVEALVDLHRGGGLGIARIGTGPAAMEPGAPRKAARRLAGRENDGPGSAGQGNGGFEG